MVVGCSDECGVSQGFEDWTPERVFLRTVGTLTCSALTKLELSHRDLEFNE